MKRLIILLVVFLSLQNVYGVKHEQTISYTVQTDSLGLSSYILSVNLPNELDSSKVLLNAILEFSVNAPVTDSTVYLISGTALDSTIINNSYKSVFPLKGTNLVKMNILHLVKGWLSVAIPQEGLVLRRERKTDSGFTIIGNPKLTLTYTDR